jgi:hypothetical protein
MLNDERLDAMIAWFSGALKGDVYDALVELKRLRAERKTAEEPKTFVTLGPDGKPIANVFIERNGMPTRPWNR